MANYRKKSDTDPSSPNKAISPQFSNSSPGSSWPPAPPETGAHSHLPGESDDNPFRSLHPSVLRGMYNKVTDPEKKLKIWKALKQWSRQYTDSLINPFTYEKYFMDIKDDYSKAANNILKRMAEVADPQRNLFYYQEAERTQFTDAEHGNMVNYHGDPEVHQRKMFVYPRDFDQGEAPHMEKDVNDWEQQGGGNFLTPTEDPLVQDLRTERGYYDSSRAGGNKVSNFFDNFVWASDEAVDAMFQTKTASTKKVSKIVKLADLQDFQKVGNNLLIHKSERDLWAMEEDDEGNMVISRLFDGNLVK